MVGEEDKCPLHLPVEQVEVGVVPNHLVGVEEREVAPYWLRVVVLEEREEIVLEVALVALVASVASPLEPLEYLRASAKFRAKA